MTVETTGPGGEFINRNIIDLHHFGTAAWLGKHIWWASHNGYSVKTDMATPEDVEEYVSEVANRLKAKMEGVEAA